MSDTTRSLLVKMTDGTQKKIHGIPANAKVTFGKVQPGESSRGYPTTESYALRIYTTQNNQLAVFTGVSEFRDLALSVESRIVTEVSEGESKRDGDGRVVKVKRAQRVSDQWSADVF